MRENGVITECAQEEAILNLGRAGSLFLCWWDGSVGNGTSHPYPSQEHQVIKWKKRKPQLFLLCGPWSEGQGTTPCSTAGSQDASSFISGWRKCLIWLTQLAMVVLCDCSSLIPLHCIKTHVLSWVQIMLPLWAKVLNSRMVCLLTTSPGNLGEEKIIQGWNHSRVMPKPAALLKHNAGFSLNKMVVRRILNWIQYVLSERRTPLKATSHRPYP